MKAKETNVEMIIKTCLMKKALRSILLFLLLAGSIIHPSSAQTAKNIFDAATPVTYLGVDFTLAKVIGESGSATDIRDRQFPAINNVVVAEPAKYDIAEALRRSAITSDLDQVNARNRTISVQQIKSEIPGDFMHLTASEIDKLVGTYDFSGKTGIGVLFVVEGMSKSEKAANIFVTFINMSNKRVLLTERVTGKAGGFGFRNYWAKPVEEVLKKIKNSKYNEWKKKYAA
ncbi:hypothetical protein [Chitinophaga sp. YIM B06452]|uniref:hypothetical protein n=1 Tax=Chitinophaga sp. YIM B06452 TaxID=3082158 RepID=UPI0031FEE30B